MTIRDRQGVAYATVEDIKEGLDIKESAKAEKQIKRVLQSATDTVEGLLRRRFYPEIRTQNFDWYNSLGANDLPWTLWLDQNEVISVTSLVSSDTISAGAGGYFLKPDDGPPYTRVELDASANVTFDTGTAYQNAITITGTFGYQDRSETAGTLVGSINSSVTSLDVSNGSLVGIGNMLKIGTERLSVTGRSFKDSTATLSVASPITGSTTLTVSNGSLLNEGETILIGGERMLIVDITGTTVSVKRQHDGTALEAHAIASAIYVSRTLTVTRGILGSTAASHTDGDALTKLSVPPLVHDLTIAEAMAQLLQERTAYARTIGAAEGERELRGTGLADLRKRAIAAYGRVKGGRAS
jgi:archaellum component FlaF (FlaF/FlaG flagellin family)